VYLHLGHLALRELNKLDRRSRKVRPLASMQPERNQRTPVDWNRHARPDLVDRVVFTSTALGRPGEVDAPGFSGSTEVLYALMGLMRRDYRSGLRQMLSGSAGGDEEFERERAEVVGEIVPQEAAIGYLEAWISAGSVDVARRLGNRLTVLAYPGNAWFPLEMYESLRKGLTEACFELVEDGPMTRPDLTAPVLLRVSEPAKG